MVTKLQQIVFITCAGILLVACNKNKMKYTPSKTGKLKITFVNSVKGNPVGLGSNVHLNPFGEQYTITKFKYYISNVRAFFSGTASAAETESYHLIDESNPASLIFSYDAKVNTYNTLLFMLGVDSIRNVSGAQTGALDPLNDMFWTWNSGYIMAKMEGTSPQSNQVNNKVEYHIGGFGGANNVVKGLVFTAPGSTLIDIRQGKTTEIVIEADFDKWWQRPNDLKITETPVCNTTGALSKKIADNYADMFTLKSVTNN